MHFAINPFRRLIADRRGVGAIELALVLPMLVLLLAGMIDVSRMVANRIDAEQAAILTTDYVLASRPKNGKETTISGIKQAASTITGVPTSDIDVVFTLECDGTQQGSWNDACATGADQARLVSVTVSRQVETVFNWPAVSDALNLDFSMADGTVNGTSVVRIQ